MTRGALALDGALGYLARDVPSQDYSLADLLSDAMDARLDSVFTSLPGKVESYDAASQTATVQPIVRNRYVTEDGDVQSERFPAIPVVPVLFPSGGGFSITWPLTPGDLVTLVFACRSIDQALASGLEKEPVDDRQHHLSDAVCIPGLRSLRSPISPEPPDDALVISGPKILLGSKDASDGVARASDVQAALVAALKDGNIVSAQATYVTASAIPGGEPAAAIALGLVVDAHFLAHPVAGSSVVKAE